jgi:hypothetical protein
MVNSVGWVTVGLLPLSSLHDVSIGKAAIMASNKLLNILFIIIDT